MEQFILGCIGVVAVCAWVTGHWLCQDLDKIVDRIAVLADMQEKLRLQESRLKNETERINALQRDLQSLQQAATKLASTLDRQAEINELYREADDRNKIVLDKLLRSMGVEVQ